MHRCEHHELQHALEHMGISCDASEWHGVVTGVLCVDFSASLRSCIDYLLTDDQAVSHPGSTVDEDVLSDSLGMIKEQLLGAQIEYELLLPEDNVSLGERIEELALWCRGFLFGLFSAGAVMENMPDTLSNGIKDIDAISMVDTTGEWNEEDEQHYFELVEYIRVLVLSIAEELQPMANTSQLLQ